MTCSEYAADIADTLAGSATGSARERAEVHMAECAACRANADIWHALGDLPVEATPALRLRRAPSTPRWVWLAAAAAIAVCVFFAGRFTAPKTADTDIATLRREVRSLREVVALSLLDQQSASERLRGIRYSSALDGTDREVVEALSRTLRNDSSVDVRLAAADALRRFPLPASVSESAWQILEHDDSPLVQIAVIDLLTGSRDPAVRARLEILRNRSGLDSNVREYLRNPIQ